jgi:hypothetical protein
MQSMRAFLNHLINYARLFPAASFGICNDQIAETLHAGMKVVQDCCLMVEYGDLHRIVEIDLIDDADEPDPQRYTSGERAKDVAKERDTLSRVQLGRSDFFGPAAHGDSRAAGSPQVAHPLNLAPGCPDPAPTCDLDDRQRRGARQAALPAANGDQRIGT